MKSLAWDRAEVIGRLRRDIWRYISQASQQDEDLLVFAGGLLQMQSAEVRYLAQLQFILSEPVGRVLEQMPFLIRRLTTTTSSEVEVSAEHIRGAIRWGETYAQRAATGVPNVFVTAPTRRAFSTPENEMLAFALFAVADFGRRTGWHKGSIEGPATTVRERVADATRWRQTRALADHPTRPPSPKTMSRVRASRSKLRYQAALEVVDLYQTYIARLDREAIRNAVEHHALLTRRDSVLLELHCAFDTIQALRSLGWQGPPTGLLRPPLIFRARRDGTALDLYFQAAPSQLAAGSRYRAIQKSHDFRGAGGLIPDLVLRISAPASTRWLLIEVKGGYTRSAADSARAATLDLLGYRRAFGKVLSQQAQPYGLGYAWGAELTPSGESEISLCTPDTLSDALSILLG